MGLDGVVADSSLAVMWRATVIADRDRSGARRLCDTECLGGDVIDGRRRGTSSIERDLLCMYARACVRWESSQVLTYCTATIELAEETRSYQRGVGPQSTADEEKKVWRSRHDPHACSSRKGATRML